MSEPDETIELHKENPRELAGSGGMTNRMRVDMKDRTCNVENCKRSMASLGMCNLHYQRRINGRPLIQPDKVVHSACTVEGCDNPPRSTYATMCAKHYHRMYRNGTLGTLPSQPKWDDIQGRRYGTLTVATRHGDKWLCACDCGSQRLASAGELNRAGDTARCATLGRHLLDAPTYSGAHSRVKNAYGPPSAHTCVDCGAAAKHWSYDHTDPEEFISDYGTSKGCAYSGKPEHYAARCVPCHKRFDLTHINSTYNR